MSAPNTQVAHFCTVRRKAWPVAETTTVRATKMTMHTVSTGWAFASAVVPVAIEYGEINANAPVSVVTVSPAEPRDE